MEIRKGIVGGKKGVMVEMNELHKCIGVPSGYAIEDTTQVGEHLYLILRSNLEVKKDGEMWTLDRDNKIRKYMHIKVGSLNNVLNQKFKKPRFRYHLTDEKARIVRSSNFGMFGTPLDICMITAEDLNLQISLFVTEGTPDMDYGEDEEFVEVEY